MKKVLRVIVIGRKADQLICQRMIFTGQGNAARVQFCLLIRRRKRCHVGRLGSLLTKIRPCDDLASHIRVNTPLHDRVAQSTELIGQGED